MEFFSLSTGVNYFTVQSSLNNCASTAKTVNQKLIKNDSQKTFIFNVASLTPLLTSSFVARQTKFLPLSCLVGVNSRVDVVTLPSGDVYELIIENNGEKVIVKISTIFT